MIQVCLLALFQMIVFLSMGLIMMKLLKLKNDSLLMVIMIGFFAYFSLYGLIAIPMTLACLPLSALSIVFMSITAAIVIGGAVIGVKDRLCMMSGWKKEIQSHSYMGILLLLVIFLQQLIVFNHIDGSADASYYIGKVTTDVYTNTLGQYDPYTGNLLKELDSRRIFACFQDYNAVIAQFFKIHPLKQAKLIMPQILTLLTSLLYYKMGIELFDDDRKKADLLVVFVFLLDVFSNTIYTNSTFLLTRTYEGKSVLANIVIPAMILSFLLLWKKGNDKIAMVLLIAVSISSCIFSASSMLIVPVGLSAGLIPWIVKERKWNRIWLYLICMLPNFIVCIEYLLSVEGIISFPIGG